MKDLRLKMMKMKMNLSLKMKRIFFVFSSDLFAYWISKMFEASKASQTSQVYFGTMVL